MRASILRRPPAPAAALLCLVLAVPVSAAELSSPEKLGEALYFDSNLSANRTQSCATCHNPDFGFADPRQGPGGGAASLGDDGRSLGDRNAPTAAYARFSPPFALGKDGKAVGGQFHDGRAATLKEQAGGPPLNPGEMAMPSKAAVRERLRENPAYVRAFDALYGAGTLDDTERAYDAMADAIARFESTGLFAPFDSKYDRALRGEYRMTPEEELGQTLFFSTQFTNCNQCHQLRKMPGAADETFTNYEFHNIGVPANTELRAINGKGRRHIDRGLLENPAVKAATEDGKFKTPTLRNVAVTGPYMHNGVFKDLETVIRFYNTYNSRSDASRINPETGKPWGQPEIAKTLSLTELEFGPALDTRRIKALVAFLKTLTDARYEHLLDRK
ncbi:methylamine utilization protein MauG [Azospirillum sp. RWY-5-1]|uniref:Methylamine utilization protein MauG n=1 Tax=Azospirillum oleiclasticum TaxID=2735135 RepID=A0ABX2T9Q4_9PROT|nr:cytochrome c peroxidase [Azospirillum oleiclasticum]NYZ12718.1 methylamine utilization protein MauG [Azospirillum oleiclasticum]NYZ19878.1 methylamine utilization protein MauG [Azospirillum oleiclasticum]